MISFSSPKAKINCEPTADVPITAQDTLYWVLHLLIQTFKINCGQYIPSKQLLLSFSLLRSSISTAMSAASSTPPENKRDRRFPPKRGQVKAQIFESFKKTVVSAVSALAGDRGNGSAAGTPPASSYNSDGNSEIT